MFSSKMYPFPCTKNEGKKFYCRFYVVAPISHFSFFIPSFQCFSCIFCYLISKILWIFLASQTKKNPPWNIWSFVSRSFESKTVCEIVFVLLWFRITAKTIKTLGLHNNTHFPNLAILDVSSRGVLRTLSNI